MYVWFVLIYRWMHTGKMWIRVSHSFWAVLCYVMVMQCVYLFIFFFMFVMRLQKIGKAS